MFRAALLITTMLSSGLAYAQPGTVPTGAASITPTGATTGLHLADIAAQVQNLNGWAPACDGTTDDQSKIQAAVTASAGKSALYIPQYSAACMIGSAVSIPSNSHIIIDGTVKLKSGANSDVFSIATNAANVIFEGHGTIDGNKSGQTTGTSGGINSVAATNVTVRDLTVQHTRNWPVNIVGTTGCLLENLTLTDGGSSPEFAGGSTNCWAYGLKISSIADEGFAFYGGVTYSGIIGGSITGSSSDGISVLNDTGQPNPSHDITISGVSSNNNQVAGVSVVKAAGGSGPSFNITITSNVLTANGQGNNGIGSVHINGATGVVIADNAIRKDGNGAVGASGVLIEGTDAQIKVANNVIVDEGQGGNLGVGITLGTGCTSCFFNDNHVIDDQGSSTTAYAFNGNAGSKNQFINNTGSGLEGGVFNGSFAADTIYVNPASANVAVVGTSAAGTYAVTNTDQVVALFGAQTSYTVTLPANVPLQPLVTISCASAITTFTVSPAGGQSINGAPTTCAANTTYAWRYINSQSTWVRAQ